MTHTAVFSLEYATPEYAQRVERAIAPEVGDIDDDRSQTSLSSTGRTLEISIEARDIVALRAALNTWFSLVAVAEQAGDVV